MRGMIGDQEILSANVSCCRACVTWTGSGMSRRITVGEGYESFVDEGGVHEAVAKPLPTRKMKSSTEGYVIVSCKYSFPSSPFPFTFYPLNPTFV